MSPQEKIAAIIAEVLTGPLGLDASAFDDLTPFVEVPKDTSMGDFAFPCFRLARALRKAPPAIAAEILPYLRDKVAAEAELSEVSAAGPYLNFRIDTGTLAAKLVPAVLAGTFQARRESKRERVMIEYSQPNTHKAFHVGHTRNVALGDALVQLYRWNGYEVVAANYIGDEGAHIAKCLWYYRQYFKGETPDHNLGEFLGDLYTRATQMLDFSLLSRCPLPGVVVARVTAVAAHAKWKLVTVTTGSEDFSVICGGKGFAVDDLVAYAGSGARIGGRLIATVEKQGVTSTGMICSEKELGFSEDNQTIHLLPPGTPLGLAVAEFYRIPDALDARVPVLEEMERRSREVARTLKLLEARDADIDGLWQQTKQWSMDEFQVIYDWLDVHFEHFFFESEVGDRGKAIALDFFEKGVLVKSEGAIGADLSAWNLPFLLLIKSDGAGLYATKDIALAREKFEKFHVDRSIYVVDASQSLHFQQVFRTLELMGYERARHCHHLAYGLVMLPEGKMGSRKGNVILFSQLRERLTAKITADDLEDYRGKW